MRESAISKLISRDWNLQCWKARYGSGVWLILAPQAGYLDQIREILTGGDIEATSLDSYFNNEGSWLPVVYATNFMEALSKLELKLEPFISSEKWLNGVFYAIERITEVNDGYYGIEIAVEQDNESILFKPDGV